MTPGFPCYALIAAPKGRPSAFRLCAVRFASALLVAGSAAGCGGAAATPESRPPASATSPASAETSLALTLDEKELGERIAVHIERLSGQIGERNQRRSWELADASDYIAGEFERLGLPLTREGYEVAGAAYQNLSVTIPGRRRGNEVVVVLANYDSPEGSRGVAEASAVAALLELGRQLEGARLERSVRLVAGALGAGAVAPEARASGHLIGRTHDAKSGDRETVVLVVELEALATLAIPRDAAGEPLREVELLGTEGSEKFLPLFEEGLLGGPIRVRSEVLGDAALPGRDLDLAALRAAQVPAIRLSGQGKEAEISRDHLAIVAFRLGFGLRRAALEEVTNDGMLTPGGPLLR